MMFSKPTAFSQCHTVGRTQVPKTQGELPGSPFDAAFRSLMQPRKEFCDRYFEDSLEGERGFKRRNPVMIFISRKLCPVAIPQEKCNVTLREFRVFSVSSEIGWKAMGRHWK